MTIEKAETKTGMVESKGYATYYSGETKPRRYKLTGRVKYWALDGQYVIEMSLEGILVKKRYSSKKKVLIGFDTLLHLLEKNELLGPLADVIKIV